MPNAGLRITTLADHIDTRLCNPRSDANHADRAGDRLCRPLCLRSSRIVHPMAFWAFQKEKVHDVLGIIYGFVHIGRISPPTIL